MLNESVIKVLKNGMWDLATCANGLFQVPTRMLQRMVN